MSVVPKVQIFIMSYNRPGYIAQAVDSVLAQTYLNTEIVVSENSPGRDVFDLLTSRYPNLKIVRREPSVPMASHWNMLLSEATSEFFMMFHDDDIMNPNCVADLVHVLQDNPKAFAAAGNAFIIRDSAIGSEFYNRRLTENIRFQNVFEFGQRYFNYKKGGVNPFPGYMYRTKLATQNRFNSKEAGKHSDATFLFKALAFGPIVWTSAMTMNYRIHIAMDSAGVDILALVKLTKMYYRLANIRRNKPTKEFMIKSYMLWLKQQGMGSFRKKHPYRFRVIMFDIAGFYLRSPFKLAYLASLEIKGLLGIERPRV